MKAFTAFVKKEFMESWRTYKLIIFTAIFILLGVMSPLLAKMTPDILRGVDMGGVVLEMPEPTALDAWGQFFNNVGQMGMLTLIIIFSGIMANEFNKGTLVNLLTKGMRRGTVILAKFLTAASIWSAAYLLCFAVCAAYTAYYWELSNLSLLAFFGLWLFGVFLIALLIFGGTLFKGISGNLLLTGGALVGLMLLNIAPQLNKFNPISLGGATLTLLSGEKQASDFLPAVLICAGATVLLVGASIAVFRKKQV